jgi:hypothetical protein
MSTARPASCCTTGAGTLATSGRGRWRPSLPLWRSREKPPPPPGTRLMVQWCFFSDGCDGWGQTCAPPLPPCGRTSASVEVHVASLTPSARGRPGDTPGVLARSRERLPREIDGNELGTDVDRTVASHRGGSFAARAMSAMMNSARVTRNGVAGVPLPFQRISSTTRRVRCNAVLGITIVVRARPSDA